MKNVKIHVAGKNIIYFTFFSVFSENKIYISKRLIKSCFTFLSKVFIKKDIIGNV